MSKKGLFKNTLVIACCMSPAANAAIVINEIDYDQPGTDHAEFIEIFNNGLSAVSLDSYAIDLINGNNDASYRRIDLSGFNINANGYFVVCNDSGMVANCDYSFTSNSSWFQNGSPDAIGLFKNENLLDSISYEGVMNSYTEGDVFAQADSNSDIMSIARVFDGVDSDNNALDFQVSCITPGTANVAGIGDCSVAVNAVPVPAAAWLFASGLLGLVGFSRRK